VYAGAGRPDPGRAETTAGSCAERSVDSTRRYADDEDRDMCGELGRRTAGCPHVGQSIALGTAAIEKWASAESPAGQRNS